MFSIKVFYYRFKYHLVDLYTCKSAKSIIIFSEFIWLSIQQLSILAFYILLVSGSVRNWFKFNLDVKQAFALFVHCAFMTFIIVLLFISFKFVKAFFCQMLFGDSFFITWFFELKLSLCVSTFFIHSGTKFQLDPRKNEKFPIRPPL